MNAPKITIINHNHFRYEDFVGNKKVFKIMRDLQVHRYPQPYSSYQ